jgi:uncharacterized protein involved in propanediol utilization
VIGYGKSFASFGEIVQGRGSDNEDFLVTLPIDLWSTCELACSPINGPLVVECELEKSRSVLYHVLDKLGIDRGYHIRCDFTRNIPIGKGLSSSTADMLATLRAVQEVFGFLFTESFISMIFADIEPHDGLHFNSCVIYNHRSGRLIENFEYIPRFTIIVADDGGVVDTQAYNENLNFDENAVRQFDGLLSNLREAFRNRDDRSIAQCATESARIHVKRTGNRLLGEVLTQVDAFSPLGIVATHSGTCAGLLYPYPSDPEKIRRIASDLGDQLAREVFVTYTLTLLASEERAADYEQR